MQRIRLVGGVSELWEMSEDDKLKKTLIDCGIGAVGTNTVGHNEQCSIWNFKGKTDGKTADFSGEFLGVVGKNNLLNAIEDGLESSIKIISEKWLQKQIDMEKYLNSWKN